MPRLLTISTQYLLLTFAGLLATSTVFAAVLNDQQQQQLQQLKQQSLQSDQAYKIIESLTTEVGARKVGTPASDKAISWAENKMHELGFDKVWLEKLNVPLWKRGKLRAAIISPYPHSVVAVSLGNSVGTEGKDLIGDVVKFNDLAALEAARPGSLNNKIAFVAYRMERHKDGRGYGPAVAARGKGASIAAEKGAIAFIMRSVGTDNNRIAHTGVMHYQDGVEKIPALALSNPDADLLLNELQRGKPVKFSINSTANGGHEKVTQVANVIGEIRGSMYPNQIVTLGAHLDSWDQGTGAMDDGIGVGVTLAAAHQLAMLPTHPKRTIRVILFAAEEIGLYGAKAYVKAHQHDMDKHMIGAEWDFGIGNIYGMKTGVGSQSLPAMKELANYLAPLGVSLEPGNDAKGDSDMGLLGKAGQPAVEFNADGSKYFDYHHTENDTLDKVDPAALKINTAIYTMFTYFAAQAPVDFRQ